MDNGYTKYYVSKLTARKLLGTYYINLAKQFATEQEAQKWIKERNITGRFRVNCFVEIEASGRKAGRPGLPGALYQGTRWDQGGRTGAGSPVEPPVW